MNAWAAADASSAQAISGPALAFSVMTEAAGGDRLADQLLLAAALDACSLCLQPVICFSQPQCHRHNFEWYP